MTLPRQASEQAMTDSHHAVSEALSVFGQSTIASLAITINVFDVPKGVLHLGTDTGFDFFDFLSPGISLLAGARPFGNIPRDVVAVLVLVSFLNTQVTMPVSAMRIGLGHSGTDCALGE